MNLRIAIISGGQTGAERAALDWALQLELPHGGWCLKGRPALDGPIDPKYRLKETASDDLLERIEGNVRDSDATVVFTLAPKATGPAQKAMSFAKKHRRPSLHLHQGILAASAKLITFIQANSTRRLHVAGSNETDEPGIYAWVKETFDKAQAILEREDLD